MCSHHSRVEGKIDSKNAAFLLVTGVWSPGSLIESPLLYTKQDGTQVWIRVDLPSCVASFLQKVLEALPVTHRSGSGAGGGARIMVQGYPPSLALVSLQLWH
ncbi:unnamed protein product [Scytosiphon promiscuus]